MSAQRGYILPLVLFGSVAILSGIGLLFYFFVYRPQQVALTPLPTPSNSTPFVTESIVDFESCAKAGNPIMESYPRRCNAEGKSFTEIINVEASAEATMSGGYLLVGTEKTSPNGVYVVSYEMVGDGAKIGITNNEGVVISENILVDQSDRLGMNERYQCQCGVHFRGWLDEETFIIYVNNALGEEYEFKVVAQSGLIDENSFRRVK